MKYQCKIKYSARSLNLLEVYRESGSTHTLIFTKGRLKQRLGCSEFLRYHDGLIGNLLIIITVSWGLVTTKNRKNSLIPCTLSIGGVYLLGFTITTTMTINYMLLNAGIFNAMWPALRPRLQHTDVDCLAG